MHSMSNSHVVAPSPEPKAHSYTAVREWRRVGSFVSSSRSLYYVCGSPKWERVERQARRRLKKPSPVTEAARATSTAGR